MASRACHPEAAPALLVHDFACRGIYRTAFLATRRLVRAACPRTALLPRIALTSTRRAVPAPISSRRDRRPVAPSERDGPSRTLGVLLGMPGQLPAPAWPPHLGGIG